MDPLNIMFVGVPLAVTGSRVGYAAFHARLPNTLPNAIWIDAPAVPFAFYHGWWEGCWLEFDQQTNYCRLYGPGLHPPVVYEGRFMPCDARSPIATNELKLKPPKDTSDMWIFPRFVAFLEDGRILVPVENFGDCPKIRKRLEQRHAVEYQRSH